MKAKLSESELEAYLAICVFIATHGYSPSVEDVAKATNLSSRSSAHKRMVKLEEKGAIKWDGHLPRTVTALQLDSSIF